MIKYLKRVRKRRSIRKDIERISQEMAQLSHYSGVEKDTNPFIAKRYNELDLKREGLIRKLAFT